MNLFALVIALLGGLTPIGFRAIPSVPDPQLTPGAIWTSDVAEICSPGYARAHRVWGSRQKYEVTLPRYGLPASVGREVEDDDLIPVCLGGDNDVPENHWPQRCGAWRGPECVAGPAAEKDREERRACREVCRSRDQDELLRWQRYFAHWGR